MKLSMKQVLHTNKVQAVVIGELRAQLAAKSAECERSSKPDPEREVMVEAVAEECHNQWAGWTQYLLSKCVEIEYAPGVMRKLVPGWAEERWTRQIKTAYADLPEDEKESDRVEARKILSALDRVRDRERGKP